MAKKDLLKSQMKRPAPLKRTQPADDAKMTEAVNRVAQDEVDAETQTAAAPSMDHSPSTTITKEPTATQKNQSSTAAKPKRGRGGATKAATQPAEAAATEEADDAEKEPLKRMTIDMPKSLHTRLKLESARRGVYMRDHIIQVIEQSLD